MKVISPLQQDGESTVVRTALDEDDDAEKDHKITLFEMSGWGMGCDRTDMQYRTAT